jgi:Family of unknown function (DUF6370)
MSATPNSSHCRLALRTAYALCALWGGSGCHHEPEQQMTGRTVTVACARCVFHMPQVQGCPWAVEIDHKRYFYQGEMPLGFDSHAPDGTCNMPRKAVVDGVIRGDRFVASRLELLPAENVPEHPTYSDADKHD